MHSIHHSIPAAVAAALCVGLLSGCAQPPEKELAAAKAAVKAAREAEADRYMPRNFKNTRKALEAAETEIAIQNKEFFLSRNYEKARVLLKNATTLATEIAADVPGAKADMKARIEEGISKAHKMIKEMPADIRKARRTKGKDVVRQMKADLESAKSALARAETEFTAGNILEADRHFDDTRRLIKGIVDQLSASETEDLM